MTFHFMLQKHKEKVRKIEAIINCWVEQPLCLRDTATYLLDTASCSTRNACI